MPPQGNAECSPPPLSWSADCRIIRVSSECFGIETIRCTRAEAFEDFSSYTDVPREPLAAQADGLLNQSVNSGVLSTTASKTFRILLLLCGIRVVAQKKAHSRPEIKAAFDSSESSAAGVNFDARSSDSISETLHLP